jgi:hypothetical protein
MPVVYIYIRQFLFHVWNVKVNFKMQSILTKGVQLLHFIECGMMCYGALESNIDQDRRPRSILLFSAP